MGPRKLGPGYIALGSMTANGLREDHSPDHAQPLRLSKATRAVLWQSTSECGRPKFLDIFRSYAILGMMRSICPNSMDRSGMFRYDLLRSCFG